MPVWPSGPRKAVSGAGSGSGSGLNAPISAPADAVLLPVRVAADERAHRHVVAARLHHLGDADAAHHRAQLHGLRVLAHVAHPEPVGRVERQVERAHQRLAVLERRQLLLDELQI